ncbi:MAG: PKD domain-containing protein [Candidatus Cloacimonetes bacterium]|nr:PKD domain-containing protein [Candidatus Cloacimonadota bacterium]
MKKYLVFLSFILLTTILFSQNSPDTLWTRNLGGNVMNSMDNTSDGGYILAGSTGIHPYYSFYLVKTDENGYEEWNNTLSINNNQFAQSIQQTMDDGYITVGYTEGTNLNVWLVKTDEFGNIIWDEEYGDENEFDIGNDVMQTEDGGYVITGLTDSYNVTERNVLLLKTDNIGNVEWVHTYGGDNSSIGYSVTKTFDNGYIIAGYTRLVNSNEDIYIVKTDSIGNVIWENTYGGDEEDIAQSIKQTDDGGYIITGWTTSFGSGSWDVMILKIDEFGNEEWSNYFGGDQRDQGYDGYVLGDGYVFTGYTESYGNGIFDMWVIKTDELGNEKWNKTVGSTDVEFGYSILQTDNLEYIIAGNIQIYGDNNFWLVKTERDFKAEFCVSDTFGYVPFNVEFYNMSLGSSTSFEWDFNNDGIIDSSEENPIWIYEEPGLYSVSLTISDGINTDTELKEEYITVYIPLIAEFEANITSGVVPLEIQFADLSTGNIIEWSWDFENDGVIDSNEQNPIWIYEESDIYTVSLTISDGINTDIETKVEYISVYDSLIAEFEADSTFGYAPLEVQYNDLSTQSQNPIITWEWDFNYDGVIDSYLQNPIYTYSEAGVYTVSLTVSDGIDEDTETKENYIIVLEPLDADFEANITSGNAPLEVQFTDLSTGDITGWMWDFDNDGTIDSNEQNPIYTYEEVGIYTVSLTVTDGTNEDTEIKEDYITVISTGIHNEIIPLETRLYQNHPNPFNPFTNIQFDIKENETGVLSIYNIKGQLIESQQFEAGQYNFNWDASEQSSGIYFYKLQTQSITETRKMLLLK